MGYDVFQDDNIVAACLNVWEGSASLQLVRAQWSKS